MAMRRFLHPVFLICLIAVLLLPSAGQGQTAWKPTETIPKTDAFGGVAEVLPADDRGIDEKIAMLRERIAEIRAQSGQSAAEATPAGAMPDELVERKRWTVDLIFSLELNERSLRDLKDIRSAKREREAERFGWKGLPGTPPFPVSLLEDSYNEIYNTRLVLKTLGVRQSQMEKRLKDHLSKLEKSGKELRLAEERLAPVATGPSGMRSLWLRDLARLRNEANEAGALAEETSRRVLMENIEGMREHLQFQERNYESAEAGSPLSRKDLDRKLEELEAQRKAVSRQLNTVLDEEHAARGTGETISPGKAGRESIETLRWRISFLQGWLGLLHFEETLWEDRFRLGTGKDLSEARDGLAKVRQELERIRPWREIFAGNLYSWAPLIAEDTERLSSGMLTPAEEASARLSIKTYMERDELAANAVQALSRAERVARRWEGDLERRLSRASAADKAREKMKFLYGVFGKLRNTELYVAEETTVVEGQKIVRPFSVTIDKVFNAFLLLLAGLWGARRLRGPLARFATRRFDLDGPDVSQLERKWTFFTFVALLALSLTLVNIPLAVFAFFGGTLAIGIGFGAQHLIGNFISSIILMFDRVISVGDIVEMEGQFGRVQSIGLRSSTIQRFDGSEVLVPNSQFLEQKVTNLTLSDRKVRFDIALGVGYGSGTKEVSDRILGIVRADGRVQKDPEPVVIFESFGDSALMFRVFFWLVLDPGRDYRIVCSDLRHRIKESLDQAGIVIPYPQQDVHLESNGPLEVKVVAPPGSEALHR
jgi:small-conductance mechanosensitive channel